MFSLSIEKCRLLMSRDKMAQRILPFRSNWIVHMNVDQELPGSTQKIYGLYGLKHHIVELRGGVTDAG